MSVLAHVILNGSLPGAPAATQALAHILNSSPEIARAFVGMLRQADIEFEPGHIQTELGHEDSRPDLTIHDGHGRVRAFVENKFWAGLTDAQPVSYLGDLPEDLPAALLFIVPQQRVTTVWNELKLRCGRAEREWQDGAGTRTVTWSRVGRKTLLITSWTHVLEGLLDAAHTGKSCAPMRNHARRLNPLARGYLIPYFPVRPEGADHQWRKVPSRELSVDLVADERGGWVTGRLEAS